MREGEDADGERRQDDEVHEPVQGDEPQDIAVAQQLAAQRYVHFVRFWRILAARFLRRRERQPAVAAQAAVPAQPPLFPHHDRVFGPDPGRVPADQLVAAAGAAQQFVVQPSAPRAGPGWGEELVSACHAAEE
ncbi:hypothetical protein GCM10017788_34350 [Amycolatopsis acidiphila]|nr:hypothetical protein GCM10017788_34350 [Amycolatopsis acidiphila]